jgi:hypothetical protein
MPQVRWEEASHIIEQDIFRQLLTRFNFDPEGVILNFTLNSKTGVVDVSYKLGFKSAKEVATILKRIINQIPEDFKHGDAMKRMMMAEWRGYKDVGNKFNKERRE